MEGSTGNGSAHNAHFMPRSSLSNGRNGTSSAAMTTKSLPPAGVMAGQMPPTPIHVLTQLTGTMTPHTQSVSGQSTPAASITYSTRPIQKPPKKRKGNDMDLEHQVCVISMYVYN